MTQADVWFVKIDEKGVVGKPSVTPPVSESAKPPRVTTIHVVNWDSNEYNARVSLVRAVPGAHTGDVLVVVPTA
jgi:hypothetical protein